LKDAQCQRRREKKRLGLSTMGFVRRRESWARRMLLR
jgi:hypothetical protein